MKTYKYLLAASLLGLAACSTDPGTSSVPGSSTPVDPGTSSVSSSEADERANEIIAAVKGLASSSYTMTVGENSAVVTDNYIADSEGGLVALDSYSRLHEKIAYRFRFNGASVVPGLALEDASGEVIEDVRYLEPEFENVDVSSIAGLEYGSAVVSDEASLLYTSLAYNNNASGLLRVSLSSDGKITASYGSGLSVVYSEIGNSIEPRLESYLALDPLSGQTVGQTNYVNFVGGNVYNGVVGVYEVDEAGTLTAKESFSVIETNDSIIRVGAKEDASGASVLYPIDAVVRGEDGLTYNMVPEYNEDGSLKSYELSKRIDLEGNEVPWNDMPRTDNAFDIGGFRKTDESTVDALRYDSYHYYGWEAEESYQALVQDSIPLDAQLIDVDLLVELPVDEPYDGYVSSIIFETAEVTNENYEEVTYLIVVSVAEEPAIFTLDDFVVAA